MKKGKLISFISLLVIACLVSVSAMAHSGRTDSSGGHYDRKNGGYHYHNGGSSSSSGSTSTRSSSYGSSSSSSSFSTSVSKSVAPKIGIVGTDIRTYIDGNEIPTFGYNGEPQCAVVIAEDLKDYGFDTSWNQWTKTLTLTKNLDKQANPIPMDYYRTIKPGQFLFNVVNNTTTIALKNEPNGGQYKPAQIFNLNGYLAISVDELKAVGEFVWDGNAKTVSIKTR